MTDHTHKYCTFVQLVIKFTFVKIKFSRNFFYRKSTIAAIEVNNNVLSPKTNKKVPAEHEIYISKKGTKPLNHYGGNTIYMPFAV